MKFLPLFQTASQFLSSLLELGPGLVAQMLKIPVTWIDTEITKYTKINKIRVSSNNYHFVFNNNTYSNSNNS